MKYTPTTTGIIFFSSVCEKKNTSPTTTDIIFFNSGCSLVVVAFATFFCHPSYDDMNQEIQYPSLISENPN